VITVSKPKDRKDPKSPEKPKEFQSTERIKKGKNPSVPLKTNKFQRKTKPKEKGPNRKKNI